MSDQSILTLMTQKCNAEEFEQQITHAIFGQLPAQFTTKHITNAKALLVDMFHKAKADNQCRAQHFTYIHRCTQVIFDEAMERLIILGREAYPARVPRQPRIRKEVPSPEPEPVITNAEKEAIKLGEIDETLLVQPTPE